MWRCNSTHKINNIRRISKLVYFDSHPRLQNIWLKIVSVIPSIFFRVSLVYTSFSMSATGFVVPGALQILFKLLLNSFAPPGEQINQ